MTAKIVGGGPRQMKHFQGESFGPITEQEAMAAQDKLGYHPAGYGFFGFECEKLGDGLYFAQWSCHGSCD